MKMEIITQYLEASVVQRVTVKRCIAYFGFVLPLIVSCTSDPGLQAYEKGDYEAAVQEWTLLAEQGDAESQASLGDMYYEGRGVPQNGEESVQWYLMAAEQNHARAQGRLCSIFGDRGSRIQTDQQKAVILGIVSFVSLSVK